MSDWPANFYSRRTVNRGLYVIGYLLKHLRGRYKSEPELSALSENIGRLSIEDVVGFIKKENAKMALRWCHSVASEGGAKKLSHDELQEDLHTFVTEAPPGTFD